MAAAMSGRAVTRIPSPSWETAAADQNRQKFAPRPDRGTAD